MKNLYLNIDLTETEYLNYKDEGEYTKDQFIFDNLMFLISYASKHRTFQITEKICDGTFSDEDIKNENNYIDNIVEPILENFSYVLPIEKNYNEIILITKIPVDMEKEELLDIFSYVKSHTLFHQNELNNKETKNLVLKEALEKHYKDDLIIYNRIIESLNI